MPAAPIPGPHSPTAKRGQVVARYASDSPDDGIAWGHLGVGIFWGFVLALILAVFANWWVNRNQRCDMHNWSDDFDDEF